MIKSLHIASFDHLNRDNPLAAGYTAVDIAYDHLGPTDAVRTEMIDRHPVHSVTSSRFDLFTLAGPHDDHHSHRPEAIEHYHQIVNLLINAGRPDILLLIPACLHSEDTRLAVRAYETAFHQLYDALKDLLVPAADKSITIALENPPAGILLSPLELRDFIDRFNSPFIRVAFNPRHAACLGDPLDWIRILDRRIVALRRTPAEDTLALNDQPLTGFFQSLQPDGLLIDVNP